VAWGSHRRAKPAGDPVNDREFAQACFVRACWLDVAVRKPGNVSFASPGHGMLAQQFVASASAAAGPLFAAGASVGARIEGAVRASFAAAGCNTNLGIVLLCAPIAAAASSASSVASPAALRAAIEGELAHLDLDDARAAYRAIALANPGGLGIAAQQDVHAKPAVNLRAAMALAAERDSIARQYANGYVDLFDAATPLLDSGFSLMQVDPAHAVDAVTEAQVQRVFLRLLARFPDSHIVRKHGERVAHTVMSAAQARLGTATPTGDRSWVQAWAQWDEQLKAQRVNPGTSADLTVAALLLAAIPAKRGGAWHGT